VTSIRWFQHCFRPVYRRSSSGVTTATHYGDHARFAVVTFLTSIGLAPDEVVELLSLSGAKAELTRYQADHIRGDAAATQYAPPSYATLRSTDVCAEVETDTDGPDGHPLAAYAAALAAADAGDLTDWRDRGPGTEPKPESDTNADADTDTDTEPETEPG
jgi:Eukaryotic-type DNA primase, large subunit